MLFNYLTQTGVVVPDTSTLKSDVQGEYVGQFGPALILADDTIQGRLIDVETTARDQVIRVTAEQANQINPNINSGIYLKSVCALHGIVPTDQEYTVVPGTVLAGTAGTIIPANSRVADEDGNYYKLISQATIGVGGTVTVSVQALEYGPLDPAPGSITQIVDGTFGWLSVTNPLVAVKGSLEESDNDLRLSRNDKLFQLSKGPLAAIKSNILGVANARWVSMRENDSSDAATIDGVVMAASGTWLCVQGGTDADVALAILRSKQTGSPLTVGTDNGTPILVEIVDPISGQTYPIMFTRPVELVAAVRVTVSAGSALDPFTAIPDAVMKYADGKLAGERGFIVGASVSPFEVSAALNVQLPELFIRKVELALVPESGPLVFSVQEIIPELWEVATLVPSNVYVVVA